MPTSLMYLNNSNGMSISVGGITYYQPSSGGTTEGMYSINMTYNGTKAVPQSGEIFLFAHEQAGSIAPSKYRGIKCLSQALYTMTDEDKNVRYYIVSTGVLIKRDDNSNETYSFFASMHNPETNNLLWFRGGEENVMMDSIGRKVVVGNNDRPRFAISYLNDTKEEVKVIELDDENGDFIRGRVYNIGKTNMTRPSSMKITEKGDFYVVGATTSSEENSDDVTSYINRILENFDDLPCAKKIKDMQLEDLLGMIASRPIDLIAPDLDGKVTSIKIDEIKDNYVRQSKRKVCKGEGCSGLTDEEWVGVGFAIGVGSLIVLTALCCMVLSCSTKYRSCATTFLCCHDKACCLKYFKCCADCLHEKQQNDEICSWKIFKCNCPCCSTERCSCCYSAVNLRNRKQLQSDYVM
ncbi:MAG: hypothetical protein AAF335_03545 [Bacteroidota bacterium]